MFGKSPSGMRFSDMCFWPFRKQPAVESGEATQKFPVSRDEFFRRILPNKRGLPPLQYCGDNYRKLMRLIEWLNTTNATDDVWYLEFYWYNDEGGGHPSCCRYDLKSGIGGGSFFETYESCGINRTLEQNCEGLYRNICAWIFSITDLRPDFPATEEELELKMAVAGI